MGTSQAVAAWSSGSRGLRVVAGCPVKARQVRCSASAGSVQVPLSELGAISVLKKRRGEAKR